MSLMQRGLVLALAAVVGGCSSPDADQSDAAGATVAVSEGAVVPMVGGEPVDTVTPYEGVWDLRTLQGRLEGAGLGLTAAGSVSHPFMGTTGVRLLHEEGELQVFVYADALARARDTAPLDSNANAAPSGWPASATLATSDNVAVIVVSGDSTLRRTVTRVLENKGN